jgi:SAM-dependent methyltransferase
MDYERPGVAETYRRARALPGEALDLWRDVLRALVEPAAVARIADVGCGTGRFSAWLADVFDATVLGLEPSARMLAAAPAAPRVRYVSAAGEALPVRPATLDLAFLSLVYHHLADPAAVARELRRALGASGRVVVRTSTREILDGFAYLAFFPEARALDERRMPARAALRATFLSAGFSEIAQQTVSQPVARGPEDYVARIGERAISTLQQIPDEAFARGLAALAEDCRTLAADHAFLEPLDVFVFASC